MDIYPERRSFQSFSDYHRQSADEGWLKTTDDPWDAIRSSALIHRVRWHTGLNQTQFAEAYRIDLDHLRSLERGDLQPDPLLVAYLTVIDREPARVRAALETV